MFDQHIIRKSNLDNSRKGIQNYEIYECEGEFKEVRCVPNILPHETTI